MQLYSSERETLCKVRAECEVKALTTYAVVNTGGRDEGGSVAGVSAVEVPIGTSSSA